MTVAPLRPLPFARALARRDESVLLLPSVVATRESCGVRERDGDFMLIEAGESRLLLSTSLASRWEIVSLVLMRDGDPVVPSRRSGEKLGISGGLYPELSPTADKVLLRDKVPDPDAEAVFALDAGSFSPLRRTSSSVSEVSDA